MCDDAEGHAMAIGLRTGGGGVGGGGGTARLPLGVGQAVLVDTIRAVTAANENIFVAASAELRKLVVGLCERGVKDIDR